MRYADYGIAHVCCNRYSVRYSDSLRPNGFAFLRMMQYKMGNTAVPRLYIVIMKIYMVYGVIQIA